MRQRQLVQCAQASFDHIGDNTIHIEQYALIEQSLSTLAQQVVSSVGTIAWKALVESPMFMPVTLDELISALQKVSILGPGSKLNDVVRFIKANLNTWWKYINSFFHTAELDDFEEETGSFFATALTYAYNVIARVASTMAAVLLPVLQVVRDIVQMAVEQMTLLFYATLESTFQTVELKRKTVEVGFFIQTVLSDMSALATSPGHNTSQRVIARMEVYARRFASVTEKMIKFVRAANLVLTIASEWMEIAANAFTWIMSYMPWLSQVLRSIRSAAATLFGTFMYLTPLMKLMFEPFAEKVNADVQSVANASASASASAEAIKPTSMAIRDRLKEFPQTKRVTDVLSLLDLMDAKQKAAQERAAAGYNDISDGQVLAPNDCFSKIMTQLYFEEQPDPALLEELVANRLDMTFEELLVISDILYTHLYTEYIHCVTTELKPYAMPTGNLYAVERPKILRELKQMTLEELMDMFEVANTEWVLDEDEGYLANKKRDLVAEIVRRQEIEQAKEDEVELRKLDAKTLGDMADEAEAKYLRLKQKILDYQKPRKATGIALQTTAMMKQYRILEAQAKRMGQLQNVKLLLTESDLGLTEESYNYLMSNVNLKEEIRLAGEAEEAFDKRNKIARILNDRDVWPNRIRAVGVAAVLVAAIYGTHLTFSWMAVAFPPSAVTNITTANITTSWWGLSSYVTENVYSVMTNPGVVDAFNPAAWIEYAKAASESNFDVGRDISKFFALISGYLTISIPTMQAVFWTTFFCGVAITFRLLDIIPGMQTYHSTRTRFTFQAMLDSVLATGGYVFERFLSIMTVVVGQRMLNTAEAAAFISHAVGTLSPWGAAASLATNLAKSQIDERRRLVTAVAQLKPRAFRVPKSILNLIVPVNPMDELKPISLFEFEDLLDLPVDNVTLEEIRKNLQYQVANQLAQSQSMPQLTQK
jgi:hypothetical protein